MLRAGGIARRGDGAGKAQEPSWLRYTVTKKGGGASGVLRLLNLAMIETPAARIRAGASDLSSSRS
jgi:hypothetical protein